MEINVKRFLVKKLHLMKIPKVILLFIIIVFIGSCINNKSALKSFNNAEYNNAAEKFQKIVKEDDPKTNFLIAEAYRKSNQINEAEKYYLKSINQGLGNEMAYYYLILSLKANNKYNAADSIAKKYIQIGNDESVISLVRNESVFITNLKKYPDTSYYKVKNLQAINTNFAEYAPSYSNGKLYFVSNLSLIHI